MLNVVRLTVGLYEENAYLGYFDGQAQAFLVDPGDKPEALLQEIERRGLTLTHIFITHGHFDHILAVPELVARTGALVWVHERDEAMLFDPYPLKLPPSIKARWVPLKLDEEQKVQGSELRFPAPAVILRPQPKDLPQDDLAHDEKVLRCAQDDGEGEDAIVRMIETPGHTPGGACFYFPEQQVMFTGDTLFRDGFGRTDFASSRAVDLRSSLQALFQMDEQTRIYPGHGDSDTLGAVKRRFGL